MSRRSIQEKKFEDVLGLEFYPGFERKFFNFARQTFGSISIPAFYLSKETFWDRKKLK